MSANNGGELQRNEIRRRSVNNAVNITESQYNGFWFTLKEEELTLGLIGDQLIEPVIIWNDTLREGPRDIKYFGLTTDQSSASFGVNCDVPNLHFPGNTFQGRNSLPEARWASSNVTRCCYCHRITILPKTCWAIAHPVHKPVTPLFIIIYVELTLLNPNWHKE